MEKFSVKIKPMTKADIDGIIQIEQASYTLSLLKNQYKRLLSVFKI